MEVFKRINDLEQRIKELEILFTAQSIAMDYLIRKNEGIQNDKTLLN